MSTRGTRLKAPDLFTTIGSKPSISVQAKADTYGFSTPAGVAGNPAIQQLGAAMIKLGEAGGEYLLKKLEREGKADLAKGASIAESIYARRTSIAQAIKEAEKRGLIENGATPYVQKGIKIRMGQLVGGSPQVLQRINDGMEDFISKQLETDGEVEDFQQKVRQRMAGVVEEVSNELPDSKWVRQHGFMPAIIPIIDREAKKWDAYYKEAASARALELNSEKIQQHFKKGEYKSGVHWYAGRPYPPLKTPDYLLDWKPGDPPLGSDEEGDDVVDPVLTDNEQRGVGKHPEGGPVEVLAPYLHAPPGTNTKQVMFSNFSSHILADIIKPQRSIHYLSSLQTAWDTVEQFRALKEPNSGSRMDAGPMLDKYAKFQRQIGTWLIEAESNQKRKMAAAQKQTQEYWRDMLIYHLLHNWDSTHPPDAETGETPDVVQKGLLADQKHPINLHQFLANPREVVV